MAWSTLRMTALNPVAPPRDGWCGIITASVPRVTGGAERGAHPARPAPTAPYPFRYRATANGANTATIATVHSSDRPT